MSFFYMYNIQSAFSKSRWIQTLTRIVLFFIPVALFRFESGCSAFQTMIHIGLIQMIYAMPIGQVGTMLREDFDKPQSLEIFQLRTSNLYSFYTGHFLELLTVPWMLMLVTIPLSNYHFLPTLFYSTLIIISRFNIMFILATCCKKHSSYVLGIRIESLLFYLSAGLIPLNYLQNMPNIYSLFQILPYTWLNSLLCFNYTGTIQNLSLVVCFLVSTGVSFFIGHHYCLKAYKKVFA